MTLLGDLASKKLTAVVDLLLTQLLWFLNVLVFEFNNFYLRLQFFYFRLAMIYFFHVLVFVGLEGLKFIVDVLYLLDQILFSKLIFKLSFTCLHLILCMLHTKSLIYKLFLIILKEQMIRFLLNLSYFVF